MFLECIFNLVYYRNEAILNDLIYRDYLLNYTKNEFLGYNAKRLCSRFIQYV